MILSIMMLAMMGALLLQLADLTLAHGEEYAASAQSRRMATTYTTGARGRILDRNGIPLAYDETSYDVQFWRDPERTRTNDSALYTESLMKAIDVIEEGGGTVVNTSYIQKDPQTGELYYDWGVTSEDAVTARYRNYCKAMDFTIPLMDDEETEKPISEWISVEDAYLRSRAMWKIPEEMPFEDAVKIMSVRQDVNMNRWRAYEPVTVAYNVSIEVVAQLDMRAQELMGIKTKQSTTRIYPWGNTASHILGYLGRQVTDEAKVSDMNTMGYTDELLAQFESDYAHDSEGNLRTDSQGNPYSIYAIDEKTKEKLVRMTRMGYSYNDYVGVAGVEKTMERYLTASVNGRRGTETVEINKHLTVTRSLDSTAPSDGNDVMLTIDLPLQQVVEKALKDAIDKIRLLEERLLLEDAEDYQKKRSDLSTIQMAETGACVVFDANTGKILAMASSPDYDPNIFMAGISEEQKELLFGEESNQPTLNRAISSRLAPGSIFKMATSLAGYMEDAITLTEAVPDHYHYYTKFVSGEEIDEKDAPRCWYGSAGKHVEDNHLSKALTRSCNFYFYTVADRVGINKLNEWSGRLGLDSKTNVELPGELAGHIGGQSALYDNTKLYYEQKASLPVYIYRRIREYLKEILQGRGITDMDDESIANCAERILKLQDGRSDQAFGEGIREALREELGIPINASRANSDWVRNINSMLTELQWKPVMTVRAGIGQGITLTTPLAAARYAATFANGGTVYDAHIVDRIVDPNGKTILNVEPTIHDQIDAPDEFWTAVQTGLGDVVSPEDGGTAANSFTEGFQEEGYLKKIIGKSGTAQVSAQNNIDIENTSWFITMAPKDDPEIVIITCIPYGLSGSKGGAPAVEEIIRYYIDRKENAGNDTLVEPNGIIP